jgi:ABC-2 type transport system ATP-binding protein
MNDLIVECKGLQKTFHIGFFRKRVEAVRNVTFDVRKNEIFGFLGPNGAGKTTTIKMLMGLIFPTAGSATVLGHPIPSRAAKQRLGFLPESPYFYDYLTGEELLDLMGRLFGIAARERKARGQKLLERVGLGRVSAKGSNLPLRKYSKGMLQRIGIAQALINDPDLVVLDEPMSGLDPIGRKEIRDLILSLRREGKTVFFSTHILSDVELLCDRVAIVVGGTLRDCGPLDQLLSPKLISTELVVESAGQKTVEIIPPDADVQAAVQRALGRGDKLVSLAPRKKSKAAT